MCFYLTENVPPLKAEEDIRCYKVVSSGDGNDPKRWWSVIIGFMYMEGKSYELLNPLKVNLNMGVLSHTWPYEISKGFHSYPFRNRGLREISSRRNQKVVTFLIPKGANYYYNEAIGEYVSDQIKCIGTVS